MNLNRAFARLQFGTKIKTRVLRQIQRLIASGVPMARALDTLYELYSHNGRKKGDPVAIAMNEWRMKLRSGTSLAKAMSGWVTRSEEMIIEAGEQSGTLDTAFTDALNASRVIGEIRGAIIGGMAYPAALLAALIFSIYGFSTNIVPSFTTIVPPEQWTGNPATLYAISQFVTAWTIPILVGLTIAAVAATVSLGRMTGKARVFLDRIPPWSIYKVVQGSSFMIALRGFLRAGIAVPDALRRIGRNGTPYVQHRTRAILAHVNMGRNLGEAMRATGHRFPDPEINGEIAIYAGLDNFTDSLDLLAREWIDNSINRAKDSSRLLSNVMLVLLALVIGYIAMSMWELQQMITDSVQQQ